MRTTSFILAFALMVVGTSLAGSAETGLPGIGTFAYGTHNQPPCAACGRLRALTASKLDA